MKKEMNKLFNNLSIIIISRSFTYNHIVQVFFLTLEKHCWFISSWKPITFACFLVLDWWSQLCNLWAFSLKTAIGDINIHDLWVSDKKWAVRI